VDECFRRDRALCINERCISTSWLCDGARNCPFGEDESHRSCNLKNQCESNRYVIHGCLGPCKPGYFGDFCDKNCSEKCLNRRCNKSSGLCNDCTRTYLESCSQECGVGCREINGFPQCVRQSGKCLNGCNLYHYGFYCNNTCKNCKQNSSNSPCDINGVCQFGCENDYWDKKCNSKCSANCQGDEHGKRCNLSTGECINGCTRGWSESTDKENVSSLKTTSIVIPVIATVAVVVVGIICYAWARKRFIRQQNDRMEPGQVLPVDVPPIQQPTGPRGPQTSSSLYAEINEDTMEQYHYICEQNSPDQYDEINVTEYDRDIGIMPSKEFTDDDSMLSGSPALFQLIDATVGFIVHFVELISSF
ncbi:SREC-like protein, partial [Mya arenaria]